MERSYTRVRPGLFLLAYFQHGDRATDHGRYRYLRPCELLPGFRNVAGIDNFLDFAMA